MNKLIEMFPYAARREKKKPDPTLDLPDDSDFASRFWNGMKYCLFLTIVAPLALVIIIAVHVMLYFEMRRMERKPKW